MCCIVLFGGAHFSGFEGHRMRACSIAIILTQYRSDGEVGRIHGDYEFETRVWQPQYQHFHQLVLELLKCASLVLTPLKGLLFMQ